MIDNELCQQYWQAVDDLRIAFKMFNVKDLVIEKIISCNICDAEGKIIGKTIRSLDDESICRDYKSDDNITKVIDKN